MQGLAVGGARAISADARAHGQQKEPEKLGEPLLRKAQSSRASHSSKGSSFLKKLSMTLSWRFGDDELQVKGGIAGACMQSPCVYALTIRTPCL